MTIKDNKIENDISNWIDIEYGFGGEIIPVSLAMTILQNAHDSRLANYTDYSEDAYEVLRSPGVFVLRDILTVSGGLKRTIETTAYVRQSGYGYSGYKATISGNLQYIGNMTDYSRTQYSVPLSKSLRLVSWAKDYYDTNVSLVFNEYDSSGNQTNTYTLSVHLGRGSLSIYTRRGVTDSNYYWIIYRLNNYDSDVYEAGYIRVNMSDMSVTSDSLDSGDSSMSVTVYRFTNGAILWRYRRRDSDGSRYGEVALGSTRIGWWYDYSPGSYRYSWWGFKHDIWSWRIGTSNYLNNCMFWMIQHYSYSSRRTNYTYMMRKWTRGGNESTYFTSHYNTDGWSRGLVKYFDYFRGAMTVESSSSVFCVLPTLSGSGISSTYVTPTDERLNPSPLYSNDHMVHLSDTCYAHGGNIRLLPDHRELGIYEYGFPTNEQYPHNYFYVVDSDGNVYRLSSLYVESVDGGYLITKELQPPQEVSKGYLITQKKEPGNSSITVDILNPDNSVYASNVPERTVVDVPNSFKLRFNFNVPVDSVCDPPVLYAYSMLVW